MMRFRSLGTAPTALFGLQPLPCQILQADTRRQGRICFLDVISHWHRGVAVSLERFLLNLGRWRQRPFCCFPARDLLGP